jgi:hypothetical protein
MSMLVAVAERLAFGAAKLQKSIERATFGIVSGCHVAHLDSWFLFSRCC